jgi:hypothetical protein
MDWAPRGRGSETLIDDSPAQLSEIRKRFRMAATMAGGVGNGYFD